MKIRADITAAWTQKGYSTRQTFDVLDCFVDSALDTDTDSWQITIGDFDRKLIPLLHRDTEVRCSFTAIGEGQFETLHSGIADECMWNDEGIMTINGRDFTSIAVDSTHPPQRFQEARPHVIVANEATRIGIGHSLKLTPTKKFGLLATDGTESYWQFWYRLYRKRRMWLWAEPDGSIIGAELNYNQRPAYFFGDKTGLPSSYARTNFIQVEDMEWRANKNSRIYEAYIIGHRGDKTAFIQKAVDPSMKGWMKKRTSIITSGTVHGPGEAHAAAEDELFESKVGATEITLTIANPRLVIRQNRMCFVNISSAGVRGEFYVVGTKILANTEGGFYQQIRLREQNYAITKRVPTDPKLISAPGDIAMYGVPGPGGYGPNNPAGTLSEAISMMTGEKNWGEYFVRAADTHHGPWPFALFLGVLLAICEHETGFENIRYGGKGGPEYPGTANGKVPSMMTEPAAFAKFAQRYGNEERYGHVKNPPQYPLGWAVGPMQLYTPSYKEYADRLGGMAVHDFGERWNPKYNIMAAAWAFRGKCKKYEAALQPGNAAQAYSLIWQATADYGGAARFGPEFKKIYDDNFEKPVASAIASASATAKGYKDDNFEMPQGSATELLRQLTNHKNVKISARAMSDLNAGKVSLQLQKILLAFANAGFDYGIWGFQTDHPYKTSTGSVSDHSYGHAADLGPYDLGDKRHAPAQKWLVDNAIKLKCRQIIGPDDMLCWDQPRGNLVGSAAASFYGTAVLAEHDNHIHLSDIWDRKF